MAIMKARVLCVDDHALVGRGLGACVELETDLEWAGWLPSAENLVKEVDACQADIVLMDIDMPGPDSFEAVEQLHTLRPAVRTLMLSAFVRDTYVDTAIRCGAWGYVSKSDEFDSILAAIRKIVRGEFAFSPDVMRRCEMRDGVLSLKEKPESGIGVLSSREIQVLRMVASGMSTKVIAGEIHRSIKRVESIRTGIMRKLGCEDRLELTRYAIREGVIEP